MKLKKTYRFAGITSLYITLSLTLAMGVFLYVSEIKFYSYLAIFAMITFVCSFLFIQNRVERFIYKKINKMQKEMSILDAASFGRAQITTDMETLTKQMGRFAEHKKLEIALCKE